ncbi:hypothetical protein R1X32_40195 [Rhodococcus opacus]|uniref:hypothetical protein n=1 Tax=Rhodococcus opacus TaxID=37919 RepID=UPI0002EBCE5B|nr:hypothetical protein HJ581_0010770 [Rhodococcus opacus]
MTRSPDFAARYSTYWTNASRQPVAAGGQSGKDIVFGDEGVGGDMGDRLHTRIW